MGKNEPITDVREFPPKRRKGVDEILAGFVMEASERKLTGEKSDLGVTLMMGGILVTGNLVGDVEYLDYWTKLMTGHDLGAVVKMATEDGSLREPERLRRRRHPRYVQLRNVRVFQTGNWMDFPAESVWRGRLDRVDGFIPGSASAERSR